MSENLVIDPFGAPEFFCNDLAYVELAAPGVIRFGLYEFNGTDRILRAKILLPALIVPSALAQVTTFMACQIARRMTGTNSLVH